MIAFQRACLPAIPSLVAPIVFNGGAFLSNANGTAVMHCDHGLRRQSIVESVLDDVFNGRLQAGTHLVTQELAVRFGVSHTPIREALIALAGIGIIDLLPNRGAVVRQVTVREVRDICQVRHVLECEAVHPPVGVPIRTNCACLLLT